MISRSASIKIILILLAVIWANKALAKVTSVGTGFTISFDGTAVTNEHVIRGCRSLLVKPEGGSVYHFEAFVLASDKSVDLALLKLRTRIAPDGRTTVGMRHPRALLRSTPDLQIGELAVTYGFPLRGLLASEGNLTSGHVTALRGLRDNNNYIQVSTPIQPGNSGGALLDSSGNVIGVVASSLDDVAVLRATGSVPQNVNFGIKVDTLRQFVQRAGASVAEEHSGATREMKDIGARARMFTSLIECIDGTK